MAGYQELLDTIERVRMMESTAVIASELGAGLRDSRIKENIAFTKDLDLTNVKNAKLKTSIENAANSLVNGK